MHSLDLNKQKMVIETYYDKDCRLQNPYMILATRTEIVSLFQSLSKQNTELAAEISSIVYDPVQQIATVDLYETINPKALGGLLPVKIHQIIKLQLERSDEPGKQKLLFITDHNETHRAQEYISRVPILGSWYDGSIREAMGKIVLTSSSIIDATGILDYVPSYVDSAIKAAYKASDKVSGIAGEAVGQVKWVVDAGSSKIGNVAGAVGDMSQRAANASGVSTVISAAGSAANTVSNTTSSVLSTAGSAVHSVTDSTYVMMQFARQTAYIVKLKAAEWVETVQKKNVSCYSPTCIAGVRCYSPSCVRNKVEGGFHAGDVVSAVYNTMLSSPSASH
ncbi:hypothetical protein HDU92_002170 [Lobulomyces angularis]|nr:hypothetical protein HDU92_002170 [Lobulomyces angularis]